MNRTYRLSARIAPSLVRSIATIGLMVACLLGVLGGSAAFAAPAAPVISGPTAIQFAYHPAGFRATLTWEPVPSATAYQVFHADTQYYVGSVAGTSAVVYGMQNVLYHYYVVAVDSTGATSTPSNVVDVLTSAPVPPALPSAYDVLPQSVFDIESFSATGTLSIKIPYDPAQVSGDESALRMMHYENEIWSDVTTSVDTTGNFVLGSSATHSVFAVVEVVGSVTSTITPYAGPHGTITPSTPQIVELGADSTTFTIAADAGYHVSDVVIDGESVGPLSAYTFVNVVGDHTITAYFASDEITLDTVTSLTGPSTVRVRREALFTGSVVPAPETDTVTVTVARFVKGVWRTVSTTTRPTDDGVFTYTFPRSAKGTYRLRATYAGAKVGSTTYAPSVSAIKLVTVR